MAETSVKFVIEKLIPLAINEVRLQRGLRAKVQFIKQQLQTIQSYLREADAKAEKEDASSVVKDNVRRLREVAHEIEDVIDEYWLQVARRRQNQRGFLAFLRGVGRLVSSVKPNHDINDKIDGIKQGIAAIKENKEFFDSLNDAAAATAGGSFGSRPNTSSRNDHKLGALYLDETKLVGINSPRDDLIAKLLGPTTTRKVIPVTGTGGVGKTTLVRKVYEHERVKRNFQCQAWVEVTHSFKDEELLKNLIKQFQKNVDFDVGVNKQQLIEEARKCLEGKRYLIVFDDVWAADFWRRIEWALPPHEKGSRVIITTRHRDARDFCKGSTIGNNEVDPYPLNPLPPDLALKLFYQKTFPFDKNNEDPCPDELKTLSASIVNKCGRIPLAIVAIGGLLSTKSNDVLEWKKVHDGLGSTLGDDDYLKDVKMVLSESYYDLPYHLKLCFLYFGIFPEDYSISCKRLFRLWIAEGFVEEHEDKTLEDVAGECLKELINRSLVEVSWRDFDGKPRSCRVHDLMHDFILEKCKELNFCQVLSGKGSTTPKSTTVPRRLAFHDQNNDDSGTQEKPAAEYHILRSCFIFSMKGLPKSSIAAFKLLKILDFEDAPVDVLPEEVGNLLHLKYLSLKNSKIRRLPRSIGKLQNLLTLDLKNSLIHELPEEINRLIRLRHLLAYSYHEGIDFGLGSFEGVKLEEGFGDLKALQKLYSVDTTHQGAAIIKELKKLRQLRKLGITRLKTQNGKALCNAIEALTCLRSLSIRAVDEEEFLDLEYLTRPPEDLKRLYLEGRLLNLPQWIPRLKNLVKLHLRWSGLTTDPLVVLKDHLPKLLELRLQKAYEGGEIHFKEGWLRALKVLRLKNLRNLHTLTIDEGALPNLEKLYIGPCPKLQVPSDICNLRKLETLRFYDMPEEFRQSMDPKQQNHLKIQHVIPNVFFFNKRAAVQRYVNNSLHFEDILKKRYGEDYEMGFQREANEVNDMRIAASTENSFGNKPTSTDKWFWITAMLLAVVVVILVLFSKYMEREIF